MIQIESRTIKRTHEWYDALDELLFLSKNLYNSTLYAVRQHFFEHGTYLSYKAVNKRFTHEQQADYVALPRKVSKLVQMLVDKSFKSFFALLKLKSQGKYEQPINIPHYLHKTNGRQVLEYTFQALKRGKKGHIGLSGTDIWIKTDMQVKFVRLVPKNGFINLEIGYEQDCLPYTEGLVASLDIGVNNLGAVAIPGQLGYLINGRPLKSMNQYYNKVLAKEKSYISRFTDGHGKQRRSSNKIQRLHNKRNAKMKDYMHKASRELTNHLVTNGVSDLMIGLNSDWKQDVKFRKANKQTFIQLPFKMFVDMIAYKCALVGIHVILVDESYTSQNSFFDEDYIPTFGKDDKRNCPSGKRIKRGLYRMKNGLHLNADINGALNILRKAVQNKQVAKNRVRTQDFVEAYSMPVVSTIK